MNANNKLFPRKQLIPTSRENEDKIQEQKPWMKDTQAVRHTTFNNPIPKSNHGYR